MILPALRNSPRGSRPRHDIAPEGIKRPAEPGGRLVDREPIDWGRLLENARSLQVSGPVDELRRKGDGGLRLRRDRDIESPQIDQEADAALARDIAPQRRMRDVVVLETLQQLCLDQGRQRVAPLRVGEVIMWFLLGGKQKALGLQARR